MILLKIYFMIKDPSDMNGVQIQAYGTTQDYYCIVILILGVKIRNMKMDFNTGGTWSRVGH